MSRCEPTTVTTWFCGTGPMREKSPVLDTAPCGRWQRFVMAKTCGVGIRSREQRLRLEDAFERRPHA